MLKKILNEGSHGYGQDSKNVKIEDFLKSLNLKEEVRHMKTNLDNATLQDFTVIELKLEGSDSYLG